MKKLTLNQRKGLVITILVLWLILLVQGISSFGSILSRYQLFNVASGSMQPALPAGTVIVVAKNNGTLYAPGDIITYKQGDIYITHRIIEVGYVNDFYYRTQGDANQQPDPQLVEHQQVLGQVIFTAPAIFSLLRKLLSLRNLLLFHAVLFAWLYLRKSRKAASRRPLHN